MAGTVAAGLFNALSFAGASFMFSKFSHSDYSAEMHRHNLAEEKLQKEKEAYYEAEVKRRDRIAELRQKKEEAAQDINTTNSYLDSFDDKIKEQENKKQKEPELSDYYKPSKQFSKYILAMNIFLACGIGYGVYKLV